MAIATPPSLETELTEYLDKKALQLQRSNNDVTMLSLEDENELLDNIIKAVTAKTLIITHKEILKLQ